MIRCRVFGHKRDLGFKDYRGVCYCLRCREMYRPGWGPFFVWLEVSLAAAIVTIAVRNFS